MADSSGPSLLPPRDSRITPEAVAERGFSQVKRGYAETEVRAFLRMVADELAALSGRERDLANRVRSLEERLAAPKAPPTDQDLITALGEETARVLGQARESAVELRAKAEDHARRVVREAQENARELRTSTQKAVETKTREAEEAARARAKDIVGEARTVRERVLTDLTERRQELERQINELRSGRGRLVETYQVVERALMQATRLMAEEPPPPSPTPTASAPDADAPTAPSSVPADAPPPAAPAPEPPATERPATEPPATEPPATEPEATQSDASTARPTADTESTTDATEPNPAAESRDVGALFQQLRSEQAEPPAATEQAEATPGDEPPAEAEPATAAAVVVERVEVVEVVEVAVDAESTGDDGGDHGEDAADDEPALEGDAALLHARDEVLAPVATDLSRRAKRAVQDEQNDVLDGLRRQRGKIDAGKVLPAADEQVARWAHVLQPAVDRAYAAGASSAAGDGEATGNSKNEAAPGALLTELANGTVAPLRTRLEDSLAAVDARNPADTEIAIAQGLGARYREWRTQDLDAVLGDALAAAFARGVYDAAPKDARLRWVAAREGKCPDCDDNALEPTTRGSDFPTGQAFPPAHPGCRCLLVVETAEGGSAS